MPKPLLVTAAAIAAAVGFANGRAKGAHPLCTSHPGRPIFHLCGEILAGTQHTTHMNDINAIFFYKGLYHAMFQERKPYPCADWAHLVSKDLVKWRRLPDALSPTKHGFDGGGVLDGSVSLLPGMDPVIIYDAHGPERGRDCPVKAAADMNIAVGETLAARARLGDPPTLGMAHPKDSGDAELRSWSKAKRLLTFPRGMYSGPTRIWYNEKLKSYNLVMIDGRNANTLYSTTDKSLQNWTGGIPFSSTAIQGGCARNFARIPGTDVFLLQSNATDNPNDPENAGAYYAVGTYDQTKNRFVQSDVIAKQTQTLDFGSTFCNEFGSDDTSRGRLLWLGNLAARDNNHTLATVVRSINYDEELDLLLANPVVEIEALRTSGTGRLNTTLLGPLVGGSAERRQLKQLHGVAAFDLELNITIPKNRQTFPVSVGLTVLEFSSTPNQFSAGGLTILLTLLSRNSARMQLGTIDSATGKFVTGLCSNRGASFNHTFPLKQGEQHVPLRVLVDHSSAEAFAGGGRAVASSIVHYNPGTPWPTTPPSVYVFGDGGSNVSTEAWGMECAWTEML
eukprot:SAG31_NODE_348_length_17296_cov_5.089482_15_plen_564_part_00